MVMALLNALERPTSVTWSALLTMAVGGTTLVCSSIIIGALLSAFTVSGLYVVVVLVALTQVSAGVLLVIGGLRLAMGSSRREVLVGVVLLFLTCGAYVLYTVTEVAGDPQDWRLTPALLAIAGAFASAGAVVLYLTLRPAARAFVSGDHSELTT
jgi:hypothetical protein